MFLFDVISDAEISFVELLCSSEVLISYFVLSSKLVGLSPLQIFPTSSSFFFPKCSDALLTAILSPVFSFFYIY